MVNVLKGIKGDQVSDHVAITWTIMTSTSRRLCYKVSVIVFKSSVSKNTTYVHVRVRLVYVSEGRLDYYHSNLYSLDHYSGIWSSSVVLTSCNVSRSFLNLWVNLVTFYSNHREISDQWGPRETPLINKIGVPTDPRSVHRLHVLVAILEWHLGVIRLKNLKRAILFHHFRDFEDRKVWKEKQEIWYE